MIQLTQEIKRAVYDNIMAQEQPLGCYGSGMSYDDLNVVDFLKLICESGGQELLYTRYSLIFP